jgi:hypothetical protein
MRRLLLTISILLAVSTAPALSQIPYSVPDIPWAEGSGNHRAIIQVKKTAGAAHLKLDWRRHDRNVAQHTFIIINEQTGDTVKNIYRLSVNQEQCEIIFGPVTAGRYFFYYLPLDVSAGWSGYGKQFILPEPAPAASWLLENKIETGDNGRLSVAECISIQARTEFNSFYPMEVIATEKEKKSLADKTGQPFILFPEDRKFPVRMLDNIPQRWVTGALKNKFEVIACKNEYYTFQIGLWAIEQIEDIKIEFSDFKSESDRLPESAFTCFNTNGVDPWGNPFTKKIDASPGQVQALWIGADIPADIRAGTFRGNLLVTTRNTGKKVISVEIEVTEKVLADRGDSELWRHSRLRWLNSSAGIDDKNTAPYQPVKLNGNEQLELSGKELKLAASGLPSSIHVFDNELLTTDIQFNVLMNDQPLVYKSASSKTIKNTTGIMIREIIESNDNLGLHTLSEIESDGWLKYSFTLEAKQDITLSDIRLNIPFRKERSAYMMGMGLPGSDTPDNHEAGWKGPHDAFWIGDDKGGLYCELRGASYMGPMLTLYRPEYPDSWYNGGKGGFRISSSGESRTAVVFSGMRNLKKGDKIQFECAFIITPVKVLDPAGQFTNRYYHNYPDPDPTVEELSGNFYGIKIINLHHANRYNPYINYPFIAVDELKSFVDRFHAKGIRVKIYYTIRELSNYVTEMWALRSLGDEVFSKGGGGGNPWLQEHLVDNYAPSWYEHIDSVRTDAAIVTSAGLSRWFNYYVEGLKWMVREYGIDGLYLDDVTYDRNMLKRMRKVMNEIRPDCLIDLHSNTGFSKGPATQYLEFFPYIDKLWFGESFDYNAMSPANWLVECSGIPFGLMGDMLHGGGNPWRGMVYGMTSRYPWITNQNDLSKPYDIWKLWDSFGIADSKMYGYWEDDPIVTTFNPDVLATSYLKDKKILISIASWAKENTEIKLTIDYKRAGLNPDRVRLTAPFIEKFQPARTFAVNEPITIEPTKGWLLIAEEK